MSWRTMPTICCADSSENDRSPRVTSSKHLMANHPPLKMVDVFAATISSLKFVPGVHVNYGETVLPMKDGLTKFNDFPSEFGGSGKTVAE